MNHDLLQVIGGWKEIMQSSPGLRQRVFNPPQDRGVELMPGVMSDDPRMLAFKEALAQALSGPEWEPTVDEKTGLSLNFLSGDAPRLLAVPGYKKYPYGIPPLSNKEYRAEKKLPDDWLSSVDMEIFDELFNTLYGDYRPARLTIRRGASTTIPDYETSSEVKKKHLLRALRYIKSDKELTPRELISNGFYPVYQTVIRLQPDKPGKQRMVNNGYKFVPANSVSLSAPFTAMRVRTAYAMSGTVSYVQTLAMAPIRGYYLNEFEFTYKHREPDQVSAKLERFKEVLGIDVTNFDFSPPQHLMERYVENFERYGVFSPRMTQWLRLTLGGPSISPSPYPAGREQKWPTGPDPFDPSSYTLDKGLPSGHPLNPDIGKFLMSFEVLARFHRMGVSVLGKIAMILAGKHPLIGFLNSADDNLLVSNRPGLLKSFSRSEGYFEIDEEEQPVFLGVIYGRDEGGYMIGHRNLFSFLVNWFSAERGLGKKHGDSRAYASLGWRERKSLYSSHPRFSELYALADKVWRQFFNDSMDAYMARHVDPREPIEINSEADRLFLINPDVIHYKVDVNDLTVSLLLAHSFYLPDEHTVALAESLYGNTILNNHKEHINA